MEALKEFEEKFVRTWILMIKILPNYLEIWTGSYQFSRHTPHLLIHNGNKECLKISTSVAYCVNTSFFWIQYFVLVKKHTNVRLQKADDKARIWADMDQAKRENAARRAEQAARDLMDDRLMGVLLRSRARVEKQRKQTEIDVSIPTLATYFYCCKYFFLLPLLCIISVFLFFSRSMLWIWYNVAIMQSQD